MPAPEAPGLRRLRGGAPQLVDRRRGGVALTAVATPRREIGRRAIAMLLAEIEAPGAVRERHIDLGYELVVRESTAPR